MRVFTPILLLCLVLSGCGQNSGAGRISTSQSAPTRPQAPPPPPPRVGQLNNQIQSLERDIADQDPNALAEIDAQIAKTQQSIISMNTEAAIARASQGEELENLRSHQAQDQVIQKTTLDNLGQAVRDQAKTVEQRKQEFAILVAPDDSDLIRDGKARVDEAQAQLDSLRAQYQNLLQIQYATTQQNYAAQNQKLEESRNRQGDIARMTSSLQADLTRLNQQRAEILSRSAERSRRLQALRTERDQILTTQSGSNPSRNSPTSASP